MAINKADLDQLFNQARVQLVGVSEGGLKSAFYDVISEFLNDSSIWTQTVPIQAVPHVRHYPVSVPEGQILRLNGVSGCHGEFIPALMPHIGEIVLRHSPNTDLTYFVNLVCNTSLPTTRDMVPLIPDWILPIWHVGLLDGLLGQMMSQPNKSYGNPAGSTYHLKRFRDAIARARVSKLHANTIGATAWRFPQSFRADTQQGGVPTIGSGGERRF